MIGLTKVVASVAAAVFVITGSIVYGAFAALTDEDWPDYE